MIAGSSQPISAAESVVPSWSLPALELESTTESTGHGRRVQRVGISYLVDKTQCRVTLYKRTKGLLKKVRLLTVERCRFYIFGSSCMAVMGHDSVDSWSEFRMCSSGSRTACVDWRRDFCRSTSAIRRRP